MEEIGKNSKSLLISSKDQSLSNESINVDNVSHFSFTAWIKPTGIQANCSGILSISTLSDKCTLNFREMNNTLGFHWNRNSSWWDSNLVVPADQWSYVGITVTPSEITVYVNDKSDSFKVSTTPINLTKIILGRFYHNNSLNYFGLFYNATLFNKALTEYEVIKSMTFGHSLDDDNLIAHYRFDTISDGLILDKKGSNHLTIDGWADIIDSDYPPVSPNSIYSDNNLIEDIENNTEPYNDFVDFDYPTSSPNSTASDNKLIEDFRTKSESHNDFINSGGDHGRPVDNNDLIIYTEDIYNRIEDLSSRIEYLSSRMQEVYNRLENAGI